MMGFKVRQASIKDAEGVAQLFDDYRVFYKQKSHLSLAIDFITERLQQRDSIIFVAQDATCALLGFTQLYPSFSSVWAARKWILNDLYVLKTARRVGVAKQLMEAAKHYAVETGAMGISLETAVENDAAQSLYESLGYKKNSSFYGYCLGL